MRDIREVKSILDLVNLINGKYYEAEFREAESSNILYVIMSPNTRFFCYKIKFSHNVLFLTDRKLHYYLVSPIKYTKIIQDIAHLLGIRKIVFIGSSKGAFGALLWSSMIKNKSNLFKTYCLAFSPITLLYPHNDNLHIPSYKKMMNNIESNNHVYKILKLEMEKYGNLRTLIPEKNVQTKLIFPSYFLMDAIEALSLRGQNITYHSVPLSVHGAINHFVAPRNDKLSFSKFVEKLYNNSQRDEDLASFLVYITKDTLEKELLDYVPLSLDKYILKFINENNKTKVSLVTSIIKKLVSVIKIR